MDVVFGFWAEEEKEEQKKMTCLSLIGHDSVMADSEFDLADFSTLLLANVFVVTLP